MHALIQITGLLQFAFFFGDAGQIIIAVRHALFEPAEALKIRRGLIQAGGLQMYKAERIEHIDMFRLGHGQRFKLAPGVVKPFHIGQQARVGQAQIKTGGLVPERLLQKAERPARLALAQ